MVQTRAYLAADLSFRAVSADAEPVRRNRPGAADGFQHHRLRSRRGRAFIRGSRARRTRCQGNRNRIADARERRQDRKSAYDRVRPVLAFYLGYFPRYQRVAREAGFGAAVDAIAEASSRGDAERTLAAISDGMVATLTASGTAADLRARVDEYRRSGIALPILMPVVSGPDSMAGVAETLAAG